MHVMTCDHIHNTHNTHNTQYTLIYAAESASEDSSPPKRRWPRAAHRKSRAPARQTCTPQSAPPPAPRTSTPADGAPTTTSVSWRTNVSTHTCQYAHVSVRTRVSTHTCQYARRTTHTLAGPVGPDAFSRHIPDDARSAAWTGTATEIAAFALHHSGA